MCIDLLESLANTPLPTVLRRQEDIERAVILRAAGMLVGMLALQPDNGGFHEEMRILALTTKGRRVLYDDPDLPVEARV
jgi:hypothetical protein